MITRENYLNTTGNKNGNTAYIDYQFDIFYMIYINVSPSALSAQASGNRYHH